MKWIAAVAGVIVIGGAFLYLQDTAAAIESFWVDGRKITLTHSDNNVGENLIIKSDRDSYSGIGEEEVYFSVENQSGSAQTVSLNFLFGKQQREAISIERILFEKREKFNSTQNCTGNGSSTNCTTSRSSAGFEYHAVAMFPLGKQSYTKNRYAEAAVTTKTPQEYTARMAFDDTILADEIAVYKALIEFPQRMAREEFFIEAVGSAGGYGFLDPWLDAAWLYRKKVTITGQTGAGANYQVLLKVGESSGATGEDFDLGEGSSDFPNAKDDGGDLRFTDNDGQTQIDFWVETVTGTTPNRLAYIWVEVTDDLGSNADVYVYFGNGSAPANDSSGTDTFQLFDDFNDSSIDSGLWTTFVGTSASITEGTETISQLDAAVGGSRTVLYSNSTFNSGIAVRARSQRRDTGAFGNFELGLGDGAGELYNIYHFSNNNQNTEKLFHDTSEATIQAADPTQNTWYRWEVQWVSATASNLRVDTDAFVTVGTDAEITGATSLSGQNVFWRSGDGWDVETDFIAVRKYQSTEPAFLSADTKESCTGSVCTVIFDTAGYTTWTVPSGVTSLDVACWGGGAGGADGPSNTGGGGGGGGAFASTTQSVAALDVIRIFVAASVAMETTGATSTASTTAPAYIVEAQGGKSTTDVTAGIEGLASASRGTTKKDGGTGGTGDTGTGDESGGGGGSAGPHAAGTDGQNFQASTGGAGGQGDGTSGGAGGSAGDGGSGGAGTANSDGGGGGGGADDGTSSVGGAGAAPGGGGGGGEGGGGTGAAGRCEIQYTEAVAAAAASVPKVILNAQTIFQAGIIIQ